MENGTGYGIEGAEGALYAINETAAAGQDSLDTLGNGAAIAPETDGNEASADGSEDGGELATGGTADGINGEGNANGVPDGNGDANDTPVDYEQIMREDLEVLRANFPELSELRDISELSGALRYAALRDLGLTAIEAYLATSHKVTKKDNRAHLSTAISHSAGAPHGAMTRAELAVARELFSGLSDAQLYNLYKRVTK